MRTVSGLAPQIIKGSIIEPPLSDDELEMMFKYFTTLAENLSCCGDIFRLTKNAALHSAEYLRVIRSYRAVNKGE